MKFNIETTQKNKQVIERKGGLSKEKPFSSTFLVRKTESCNAIFLFCYKIFISVVVYPVSILLMHQSMTNKNITKKIIGDFVIILKVH